MKFSQQLATNILLAGVLLVLVLIWDRMPPTAGEISAAKTSEAKRAIRLKRPAIALTDTIDVNVENDSTAPIPVTIEK